MKYSQFFAIILISLNAVALPKQEIQITFDPQELLQGMTLPQKAAQLLVGATVASKKYDKNFMDSQPYKLDHAYAKKMIEQYEIGSLIFLGVSTLAEQAQAIQEFQSLCKKNPMLVLLDAEWGLNMRLEGGYRFPHNMTLGGMSDNSLIYQKGFIVGNQLREIGVHMNLGPVVDVNNNPGNIVINDRSFGSDALNVAQKGIADMRGLQDAGIIACLKHFPGHGDTSVNSHYDLPVIIHDRAHLNAIELLPFKMAIDAGAQAIMTAHIKLPQIDPLYPATLSKKIITDLLRNEFGFNGLIIADGMGMKGITDHFELGEAAVMALAAGVDMILCANVIELGCKNEHIDPIGTTITAIVNAVTSGRLTQQDIDQKVMRILQAKKRAFENQQPTAHSIDIDQLKKTMYRQALTIAKDTPMREPHRIVPILGMNKYREVQFGVPKAILDYLKKLKNEHVTVILYGSPYAIELVYDYADRIIVAYEDDPIAREVVAEFLEGKCAAPGRLPIQEITRSSATPKEIVSRAFPTDTYSFMQLK